MDLEDSSVQWQRDRFVVSPKDLCSALVEKRADGSVELVHRTAKMYVCPPDITFNFQSSTNTSQIQVLGG